jgi:hypothetical protein
MTKIKTFSPNSNFVVELYNAKGTLLPLSYAGEALTELLNYIMLMVLKELLSKRTNYT